RACPGRSCAPASSAREPAREPARESARKWPQKSWIPRVPVPSGRRRKSRMPRRMGIRAASNRTQSFDDFEQLNVENESAGGRTLRRALAVSQFRGNPQTALFAFHHELHAFGPAGDDLVQREHDGLVADDRAIEEFAVSGPTGVV